MKILIDARFYGWEHAGLGRYTRNLIHNLAIIDKKNSYLLLLNKAYFDKVNLPSNWTKIVSEYKNYTTKEQLGLLFQLNKIKPDIVHFLHLNIPVFYKGRFIVTLHDMTMHSQGRSATTLPLYKYLIKRIPYRYVFRVAALRSEKIIVPTIAFKQDLISYYELGKDKISVIYEGVEDSFYQSKGSRKIPEKYGLNEKEYFIYTGNLYPHKNIQKAIDAIKEVNLGRSKPVYLALVSSKNLFSDRMLAYAKETKAQKYVKFLGFVEDEELLLLYKNSAAYVFPSFSEGFGLPGLEAMAAGALVLASDLPVLREVYADNAQYFNAKDTKSLKTAMEKALDIAPQIRKSKTDKAKRHSLKYSWKNMAKQTLQVYSQLEEK
jgi:glycosyltransferase involved in cell wall biosynthesis